MRLHIVPTNLTTKHLISHRLQVKELKVFASYLLSRDDEERSCCIAGLACFLCLRTRLGCCRTTEFETSPNRGHGITRHGISRTALHLSILLIELASMRFTQLILAINWPLEKLVAGPSPMLTTIVHPLYSASSTTLSTLCCWRNIAQTKHKKVFRFEFRSIGLDF